MRRVIFGIGPSIGLAVSLAALLAACSGTGGDPTPKGRLKRPAFSEDEYGVRTSARVSDSMGRMPKGGGTYKLGNPYSVAGRWYVPREEHGYDRSGIGSWYGDDFHGRKTANGEVFDMHALSAAHPTLPLPSYAYVTNLQNGRTILVRVNDRGPYVRDRIIDLSHASARALGYDSAGRAQVRVRYAGRAPLNGDDRHERQFLASQSWSGGGGVAVASNDPLVRGPVSPPVRRRELEPVRPEWQSPAHQGQWSATDYRAGLAGKSVPPASTASDLAPPPVGASQPRYAVSSADLPPVLDGATNDPYRAPSSAGGLTWKASPPSQAAPWSTAQPTGSTWRGGLGATSVAQRGSGTAYVQVGTFRDRGRAEHLRGQLAHLGPVELAAISNGDLQAYRVRIGPMSESNARAALSEVTARGVTGGRVVSE